MQLKISDIRRIIRESFEQRFKEDTDRVRRHKDGYGDDLEEDTDRVRRHKDGYGDQLEECGTDMAPAPHVEPDGDELAHVVVIPMEGKKAK